MRRFLPYNAGRRNGYYTTAITSNSHTPASARIQAGIQHAAGWYGFSASTSVHPRGCGQGGEFGEGNVQVGADDIPERECVGASWTSSTGYKALVRR